MPAIQSGMRREIIWLVALLRRSYRHITSVTTAPVMNTPNQKPAIVQVTSGGVNPSRSVALVMRLPWQFSPSRFAARVSVSC